MTNAERQARHQAKKLAEHLAANPIPDWMKGAMTLEELSAGALKLEDEIANEHDPVLRAQLVAEAAAAEAAQEDEDEGEGDEDE